MKESAAILEDDSIASLVLSRKEQASCQLWTGKRRGLIFVRIAFSMILLIGCYSSYVRDLWNERSFSLTYFVDDAISIRWFDETWCVCDSRCGFKIVEQSGKNGRSAAQFFVPHRVHCCLRTDYPRLDRWAPISVVLVCSVDPLKDGQWEQVSKKIILYRL